jgi:DnaK suppressor protein
MAKKLTPSSKKQAKKSVAPSKKMGAPEKKEKRPAGGQRSAGGTKTPQAAPAVTGKGKKASKTQKVVAGEGVELIRFKGSKVVVSIKRVRPEVKKKEEAAEALQSKVPPLSKRISREDLTLIKNTLVERRRALIGTLEAEYEGARESLSATGGDEADMAAGFAMSDLSLRLAEGESKELRDIEDALRKIEDGSFGICEATGKLIEIKRLRAIPHARLSIEAQRQVEMEQLRYDEESHAWIVTDEEEEPEP